MRLEEARVGGGEEGVGIVGILELEGGEAVDGMDGGCGGDAELEGPRG